MKNSQFTVSGPGLDKKFTSPGPALSRSVTAASRGSRGCTFYVRDPEGNIVGRSEQDEHGVIRTWRQT